MVSNRPQPSAHPKSRRKLSDIDEENEFLAKQYHCIKNNVDGPHSDEKSPESIEERFAESSFNPFSRLYHSNKDPKADERLKRELAQ